MTRTMGATNRFANWKKYREDTNVGILDGMTGLTAQYLTPLGRQVLDQTKAMVGRAPKHKGCSRAGIYLKWLVEDTDNGSPGYKWKGRERIPTTYRAPLANVDAIMVFRDWLLDQGIDVTWTDMEDWEYSEEQTVEWIKYMRERGYTYTEGGWRELREQWEEENPPAGRLRRYVKLDLR